MSIQPRKKMMGGKNPSAPSIEKPRCPNHKVEMVYLPQQLVWKCIYTGCKMTARVNLFGDQSAPTILRGTMEFLSAGDGTPFIYFPESSLLFPVSLLPDDTVVVFNENETVSISMTVPFRKIET